MCAGRDNLGDFHEMQIHRLGVAGRQDQGRTLALLWADGAEDVGGGGALIAGRAWTGAAFGPPAGNLVLLGHTSFLLEPDFFFVEIRRLRARGCVQAGGESFLKSSIAPSACA